MNQETRQFEITVTREKFDSNLSSRREGTHHCLLCGLPIKRPRHAIHLVNGGGEVLRPGAKFDRDDPGEMGLHAVGPECRKKDDWAEWTHKVDWE